jgi:phage gp37-like protein
MFAVVEAQIIARLVERVPAGTFVGTLDDLERVPELRQKAPAVWVIYDGYSIAERLTAAAGVVLIRQDWYVVVASKSARGAGATETAKTASSELAQTVIEALLGFNLGGGKYLQMEQAPGPEYDGGYCHVPLAFSSAATFKAQT